MPCSASWRSWPAWPWPSAWACGPSRRVHRLFYNNSSQETAWETVQIIPPDCRRNLACCPPPAGLAAWSWPSSPCCWPVMSSIIWVVIAQSNISGIERLFEIIAIPLLAGAIYRRAHRLPARGARPSRPASNRRPPERAVLGRRSSRTRRLWQPFDRARGQRLRQNGPGDEHCRAPKPCHRRRRPCAGGAARAAAACPIQPTPLASLLPAPTTWANCSTSAVPFGLRLPAGLVTGLGPGGSVAWLSGNSEPEMRALIVVAELPSPSPIVLTSIESALDEPLALLATVPPAAVVDWALERRSWLSSLAETIAAAWVAVAARDTSCARARCPAGSRARRGPGRNRPSPERRPASNRADPAASNAPRPLTPKSWPRSRACAPASRRVQSEIEASRTAPAAARSATLPPPWPRSMPRRPNPSRRRTCRPATWTACNPRSPCCKPELDYYRQQEQVLAAEVERLRAELVEQAALLASAPAAEARRAARQPG